MDIKTEKIRLVEKLMLLEDVHLIQKVKDLLNTPSMVEASNNLS
tara:strand:+ start:1285 stop:1416 length:132 start_codon:yes stop_codon:yes gene_type:complete